MALNPAAKICVPTVSNTMETVSRPENELWAEPDDEKQDVQGAVGAIKSLFDPNEKTKSGKVLPKAYLKSAREVVKTLRESLKEDPKDIVKFRRTADSAKESIRDYLSNWKGQDKVAREESYVELEKAIRSLASFYSKAGPSAPLPEEIKNEILNDLSTAEEFL
ncbi:Photosystem II Pbs27 - like 2 [Theobroma cacao]|nr:Photosystem II Pbs27 - like 2 [Theobroma cacao]